MDITIEKNKHNGALVLSAIHHGHLVTKQYYFYSTRAAKADFIHYLRGL
jgi:hypothetical protein